MYSLKHFQVYELVPPEIYAKMGSQALSLFDEKALMMLDNFRDFVGKPVVINNWHAGGPFAHRGWRSLGDEMKANPNSKGHSAHQAGEAFDADVQGMTAEEVRKKILDDINNPLTDLINRLEGLVTWVHFDHLSLPLGTGRIHVFTS